MPCITDIEGVFANGMHAGIKPSLKKDLAYIYLPKAYATAGVFTRNQFTASSVDHTKTCIQKGVLKAMVINSGNANAGTGQAGAVHTKQIAKKAAQLLGLKPSEVGVASTGRIGEALPVDKILKGLETMLQNPLASEGHQASEAILTTDLCAKETWHSKTVGGKKITVAGFTKGSGMIAPNMATTLTFLATNVQVKKVDLQRLLREAVNDSFNMLSVDTDTSTNDMLLLFSSGEKKCELNTGEEWEAFKKVLWGACIDLAKKIAKDGEGATKLIEVQVTGAAKGQDARTIAKNIVNSPLVKTALHGGDPNWGRIMAAACREPQLKLNIQKLVLTLGGHVIFEKGMPALFSREAVVTVLKKDNILIQLDLNLGKAKATAWGCDLTKGYIDINVEYS